MNPEQASLRIIRALSLIVPFGLRAEWRQGTVLADRVWPGQNAVGKRLIIDYGTRGIYPHEVIGLVESSRVDGLRKDAPPEIFLAHAQVPYAQMNIVLRTSADPTVIAKAAQRVEQEG